MSERTYENIFVTRDAPLIVTKNSDTRHYGTIYLEDGAYIEIRAGETFTVETVKSGFSMKHEDRMGCVAYPTLKTGERLGDYDGYDIIVTSAAGSHGSRGDNGGSGGGAGERGRHGGCGEAETRGQFYLTLKNLERNVKVLSAGGDGGKGGDGGRGGAGWDGTAVIDPGTVGGNGGRGGNGGHGSDAVEKLYVHWESKEGYELTMESKASAGGQGGCGGAAGDSGQYYDGAVQPAAGLDGECGKEGKAGEISRVFKFEKGKNPLAGMFADAAGVTGAGDESISGDKSSSGGTVSLDFGDPVQARRYLDHFGGEEFLSANYPAFYQAFLKTAEAAKEKRLSGRLPDGTISSSFGVTAINSEKPPAKRAGRGDGVLSLLEVYNYTEAHDARSRFSIISGEIQNETDHVLLESYGVTSFGRDFEFKLSTRPLDYVGLDGKELQETSFRTFVDENALLGAEQVSSDAVLVNGLKHIIKNIKVTMPKSETGNNPLIYLYNRTAASGETSDKDYGENEVDYHDSDNTVNTLLGISGSFTFNRDAGVSDICGYSMKSDTNNRRVMVDGTGAAEFSYEPNDISAFFQPEASEKEPKQDMTVTFSFPDDWKCRLDKNVYDNGAKSVILYLLFSFYYKIKITDPTTKEFQILDMPITIKSASTVPEGQEYYESENSTIVLVPPIKIRWGCFGADTRIRMADGTMKRICDLKCRDRVATPTGNKEILEVYYGTEASLIRFQTDNGCSMAVTKDHPVLTKRGVIRAEYLDPQDEVKMEDGSHGKLRSVYEVDYEEKQPVYNIEVDGGLIYAEGFLSGDFGTQNDLARFEESKIFGKYGAVVPGKAREQEFPEEAKAVAEELKRLFRDRFDLPFHTDEEVGL